MLTEVIARKNEDGSTNDIKLLDGFLNPAAYTQGGTAGALNSQQAAGSILMGLSDDTGNEIDEFVTDTLRNNLLGLPLDLPTINMTRARSEGIPPLNQLRAQIYATTQDSQLKPYTDWIDFGMHLKHPESLINFVAAYGKHPSITGASGATAKRDAARAIVDPSPTDTTPVDAADFLNGTGSWAGQQTGLNEVDLWVGGLAERTNLFGGLLGSTFNYVFESQLTDLQNSDRLYYLGRTPGMNLRSQLEGNSFAELVMRNTTAHTLKADAFATADCKFELGNLPAATEPFTTNILADDPASECDESKVLIRMADGTIRYRTTNTVDPPGINGQSVYNGRDVQDKIFGGVDNDTFLGNGGDDIIEGSDGADVALGGDGNDRITDNAGDDVLKGGPGNDAIEAGPGLDIIMGGEGKDFMNGGANINEVFAGPGDDFFILGQGEDAGLGDSGDDWLEGGDQPDLLQGDSGGLFFDDRNAPGHDIFIGQAGDDDYDAEGGDDIMVTGPGIEKNAGAAGFDWSTGFADPQPQDADLNLRILPPSVIAVDLRDRFNETEGLSGGPLDDKLRGDELAPSTLGGGGFLGCDVLDQASLDRISGLDELVPPLTQPSGPIIANAQTNACNLEGPIWGDGNIILGGGGSDLLEGRGANDILDGDKYLSVRLSVRDHTNPAVEIGSADLMESQYLRDPQGNLTGPTLQQAVFAGTVDPGDIVAVREILAPSSTVGDIDTAVFSDALANYTITSNADGSTTVAHTAGGGGGGGGGGAADNGIDTLWNMERMQFIDQTVPVAGAVTPPNTPTAGTPVITGTPQAGVTLSAGIGSIADVDGIASISFAWQASTVVPGVFVTVGAGPNFTPGVAQIGRTLRVVATVVDNLGVSSTRTSATTAAVAPSPPPNTNVAATGTPIVTDAVAGVALAGRPRVNEQLGADTTPIADVNGLTNVVFNFQWQRSADGVIFTDIAGATRRGFVPTDALVGDVLRVRVRFTDNDGFVETRFSAATLDVRPARGRGGRPPVLVLSGLAVPRTVTASTVATSGLRLSFTAPASTTLVRVVVFRVGSKRPLLKQFIPAKRGKVNTRLRTAAMKRALRLRGHYRIEFTPGSSRTKLGKTTVRMVTVRR
jgi:Ca2+-binding RTX toxin-like protein